jgi:hypothetical protein
VANASSTGLVLRLQFFIYGCGRDIGRIVSIEIALPKDKRHQAFRGRPSKESSTNVDVETAEHGDCFRIARQPDK